MANVHWANAVSGCFANASGWIGGMAPGSGDVAFIDAAGGTPYAVTVSAATTLTGLDVESSGTLTIGGGTLKIINGTGTNAQAGTISGSGEVFINGAHAPSKISVNALGLTLSGGGLVRLFNKNNGTTNAQLGSQVAGAALLNVDDKIQGSGLVGGAGMNLTNGAAASIVGNSTLLTILSNTIINEGRITALGGAVNVAGNLNNTGVVTSSRGGTLILNQVDGGGLVRIIGGSVVDALGSLSERIQFVGIDGVLNFAHAASYTGSISGFSENHQTEIILQDIEFSNIESITYVENSQKTAGYLRLNDGTNVVNLRFVGNYSLENFSISAAIGGVGTVINSPTGAPAGSLAPALTGAMAGFGSSAGGTASAHPPASAANTALLAARR